MHKNVKKAHKNTYGYIHVCSILATLYIYMRDMFYIYSICMYVYTYIRYNTKLSELDIQDKGKKDRER